MKTIAKWRPVETVATALEKFAERGVFRGYSEGARSSSKAAFKMLWHRDRTFELIVDLEAKTLSFPVVLPEMPAKSEMYREFKEWVEGHHAPSLVEHRRVDPAKCVLSCKNIKGDAGIVAACKDSDWDYATRKLIAVVHEVYLEFINDGKYYEYMIDVFDLDPDHM